MIPTYNEAENIPELVREILALPLDADVSVLVVDDDSPDGTGTHRGGAGPGGRARPRPHPDEAPRPRGRRASTDSRRPWRSGPDLVVEMDGDFSHQPRHIPDLVAAADRFDVVLGSRFVPGGRDADRSLVRRVITLLVRLFIRRKFRVPVKDVSSGSAVSGGRSSRPSTSTTASPSGPPSSSRSCTRRTSEDSGSARSPSSSSTGRGAGPSSIGLTLVETLVVALRIKRRYGPAPGRPPRP